MQFEKTPTQNESSHDIARYRAPRMRNVAGQGIVDLWLLGLALTVPRTWGGKLAATAPMVGLAGLDYLDMRRVLAKQGSTEACVRINKPLETCYNFWNEHERFTLLFKKLHHVAVENEGQVQWIAKTRGPGEVSWRLMRIEGGGEIGKQDASKIVWRASDSDAGYIVLFRQAPGGRGTEVRLRATGHGSFKRLFGGAAARDALTHFKSLVEAGEIASTQGQPSGRRSLKGTLLLKGAIS